MRVLDLGAGPGDVAFLVAEAVGLSGSLVGVDREERSVQRAQRRAAEFQYGNVTFAVASDDTLPPTRPSTRRLAVSC
jgi:ubiquinone/menaquinone biosynthesis C-methylase UbiE